MALNSVDSSAYHAHINVQRISCNWTPANCQLTTAPSPLSLPFTAWLNCQPSAASPTHEPTTSLGKVSHIIIDGQSIRKSWCRAPSVAHDWIFITLWQLRSCFHGAPSLKRGQVCLLYMLLALASVVLLGSESLGTCEHLLLSQVWEFPFRRLLWLAGSWWRYSNLPPHRLNFT
jgi:hypothetical protein